MKAYKFADYPSNSSVASGVTLLVSAWFLVAAGAILSDSSTAYAPPVTPHALPVAQADEPAYAEAANIAIAPDARFTVHVEASRAASLKV